MNSEIQENTQSKNEGFLGYEDMQRRYQDVINKGGTLYEPVIPGNYTRESDL